MKKNSREDLLQNAVFLFIKNGYDNTSITDITSACNITKGAFYHHFKNKDEIFIASVRIIFEEIKQWITNKIKSASTIKELIDSYFDFSDYFSSSAFYSTLSSDIYVVMIDLIQKFPHLKNQVASYFLDNMPLIVEKLEEGKREMKIKADIDVQALALHIIVLVEGILFMSVTTGMESSLIENGRKIASNLWEMMKA